MDINKEKITDFLLSIPRLGGKLIAVAHAFLHGQPKAVIYLNNPKDQSMNMGVVITLEDAKALHEGLEKVLQSHAADPNPPKEGEPCRFVFQGQEKGGMPPAGFIGPTLLDVLPVTINKFAAGEEASTGNYVCMLNITPEGHPDRNATIVFDIGYAEGLIGDLQRSLEMYKKRQGNKTVH